MRLLTKSVMKEVSRLRTSSRGSPPPGLYMRSLCLLCPQLHGTFAAQLYKLWGEEAEAALHWANGTVWLGCGQV